MYGGIVIVFTVFLQGKLNFRSGVLGESIFEGILALQDG
jgi:hypothetical protein